MCHMILYSVNYTEYGIYMKNKFFTSKIQTIYTCTFFKTMNHFQNHPFRV